MKKKIFLILISIIAFTIINNATENKDNLIFSCEGELLVEKSISHEKKATMHADINYFLYKNNIGVITLNGSIENYHINKVISFSYNNESVTGLLIVKLNDSAKRHIDNTPDELSKYFFGVNNNYIIRISRLNKNTYLISNLSKPIMLCLEN